MAEYVGFDRNGAGLVSRLWCVVAVSCVVATSTVQAAVNLEWRPQQQAMEAGEIAEIGLYAVSDSGANELMSVVEVILSWDPTKLELVGILNNGPYVWLSSNFPNDAAQDRLNAPYTGLPANDGNAWYNALSRFPPSPTAAATPSGLLVTTFRFRFLDHGTGAVSMPAQAGLHTKTQVISGTTPGLVITGVIAPPAIICDLDLEYYASWVGCLTGPESGPYPADCDAFDFDGDGDVDLQDFAALAVLWGCG